MAGENDFFLKFGSNAESFGQEVKTGVDAAYAQIGRLSDAVQRLNNDLRASPAKDFLTSIEGEMKGVGRTIAKSLSTELRRVLTQELSNLNIAANINVAGNANVAGGAAAPAGRGRTNATATPEIDRLVAQISKSSTDASKAISKAAADAIGDMARAATAASQMGTEGERMFQQARAALSQSSQQVQDLVDRMGPKQRETFGRLHAMLTTLNREAAELQAAAQGPVLKRRGIDPREDLSSIEDHLVRQAEGGIDDLGVEATQVATELSRLQEKIRVLSGFLGEVMGGRRSISQGDDLLRQLTERDAPGEKGQVGLDPEMMTQLVAAANKQNTAAETFQTHVSKFGNHIDRLSVALQNIRVTGVAPDARGAGPARATQPDAPAPEFLTQELSEARRLGQEIFDAFEPIRSDPSKILESPAIAAGIGDQRAAMETMLGGGDDAAKAVNNVLANAQTKGKDLNAVMESYEAKLREVAGATEMVIRSEVELAASNDVRAAKNRVAAQAAGAVRGGVAAVDPGPGPDVMYGPPAPTNIANRQARLRTERQRNLANIFQDVQPQGAVGQGEGQGLAGAIADEYRPIFDRDAMVEQAIKDLRVGDSGRAGQQTLASSEYANRLQQTFRDLDDDMVNEARKTLRESTGRASPRLENPDLGTMSMAGMFAGQMATDPEFQRQRNVSRALQLSEFLEEGGRGSIHAATRGGSLEELNRRLGQVGVQEPVSSRAEGKTVVAGLQAQLQDLVKGFSPRQQEEFRQFRQMDPEARREAIQHRRALGEQTAALGTLSQSLIRSGSINPPRGAARAPALLHRVEGDVGEDLGARFVDPSRTPGRGQPGQPGRGFDPQMERVARAQEVVDLAEMRDRYEAVGRLHAAMAAVPDLSVKDLDDLPTGTAQQGRVKRLAVEALEQIDNAIVQGAEATVAGVADPQELARIQRFQAGARARIAEREATRIADETRFQKQIEAAGRTETVQRGGLRALSQFVDAPEGARMGVDLPRSGLYLNRLSPDTREQVATRYKRSPFSEDLMNLYDTSMQEAQELNRQRLLRSEAQGALAAGEAGRTAGLDVDEGEMQAAQRIIDRTAGVVDRLRAVLERVLVAPDPVKQQEMFRAQQGMSVSELIFRGSADAMAANAAVDPEANVAMAARQNMRERLERQAIREGTLTRGDMEGLAPAEVDARLKQALPDVDVGRALADADKLAVERLRAEENLQRGRAEVASSQDQLNRNLVRSSKLLMEGPTKESLAGAITADEARVQRFNQDIQRQIAAQQRMAFGRAPGDEKAVPVEPGIDVSKAREEIARLRGEFLPSPKDAIAAAQPFLGREEALRRTALGEGTPADIRNVIDAMGGVDAVVDKFGRTAGGIRGSEDLEFRGEQQRGLREAPQRLAEAEADVVRETKRLAAARKRKADLESKIASGARDLEKDPLTRTERLLLDSKRAVQHRDPQSGKTKELVGPIEAPLVRAQAEAERQNKLMERRTAQLEERRRNIERNRAGRVAARQDIEGVLAGGGSAEAQKYIRDTATTQVETMSTAVRQMEGVIARVGRQAGLQPHEWAGATSLEELEARIQALRGSVDRNTQAENQNTRATQQSTGRMSDAEALAVRAQGIRGTIPVPAMDQTKIALSEFLEGGAKGYQVGNVKMFSDRIDDIFRKGEEFARTGETSRRQTGIRNQLALLAGPDFHQFATEGALRDRAGYTLDEARRTAKRTDITPELVEAAKAGRAGTAAELRTEGGLGEAQSRQLEANVSKQILSTLAKLEASISQLVQCCKMMREGGVGGGGGPQTGAGRRLRADDETLMSRVHGRLSQQVAGKIAGGDLAEAAMELMADPNLGFNADEARRVIAGMQKERVQKLQGMGQTDTQVRPEEIPSGRLLTAEHMRGISQGAFGAFRAGDVENTARAILKAKDDVDIAMREVGNAFSLTSDQVEALRGPLEQYQQQLREEALIKQTTTGKDLNPNERMLAQVAARNMPGTAGAIFDLDAPDRLENARQVMGALMAEGAPLASVLTHLREAFKDLSASARLALDAEARLEDERRQSVMATRMAQEAEERFQRLRAMLPASQRRRLDEGELSGRQVAERFRQTSMGRLGGGKGAEEGLQTIIDEGLQVRRTGGLDADAVTNSARRTGRQAGDAFVDNYMQSLGGMDMSAAIFGPGGSLVTNVMRTAGNFIGRYIGGAIVFGLAMRLKELVNVALETEQTFIRVSAALDATGKSSNGVKERLQDIAVATNVSLADTYEVMAQLVGVFDSVDEAARATEVVSQMELISQGALSAREGYRALSAVVTSFQETLMDERGLTNEGAITYVADLATRLQDVTGVNIEDTIEGVGRLGETANSMGIELEFLASTLALSGKATGQTGTVVSEAFGRVLSQLQNAKATDILVRMGITDDATVRARDFQQIMIDLFRNFENLNAGQQRQLGEVISDPRQFYIVNAALQQGVDILDIWEQSQNNAGAAAERTDAILDTLRGQIGQLGKQVQVLVENLVNLGLLNVFGVLVKGASFLLGILNQVLQTFNRLMEMSPFAKMALHIGMAVVGLKVMAMLMNGIFAQMGRYAGVPGSTGVRDTMGGFREKMGQRRADRLIDQQAATQEMQAAQRARAAAEGTATAATARRRMFGGTGARVGGRISEWGDQARTPGRMTGTAAAGWAARGVGSGVTRGSDALSRSMSSLSRNMPRTAAAAGRVGGAMSSLGRGLRANAGAILGYAFALALVADMVMSKAREMQGYYDDLYRSQPQDDETDEEARVRSDAQKRQDYVRDTTQRSQLGRDFSFTAAKNNLGENLSWFMDSPWEYLTSSRSEAGAIMAGELKEPDQSYLDAQKEALLNARDNMDGQETVDEVRKLEDELRKKADELIANQPTTAGKAEVERQVNALLGLAESIDSSANAALHGLAGVTNFTLQQIDSTSQSLQFVSGMNNRMREQFGGLIRKMMGERGLPPEAIAAIDRANQAGMSAPDRLAAHIDAQDMLIRQAEVELDEAEGLDEIDAANQKIEELMGQRMEYENQLIQMLVDLPKGAGEYALRFGQYAEASRLLSQAADAARANAADEDPGSPEERDFLNQALDLERQAVEAGIAQVIQRLEYSSASSRDPMVDVGNQLQIARTRLEAAMENPGAFTPEEIAGFVNDIAELHQQIADAQDEITVALVGLRSAQTGNALEQANIEYAEALRQYNRAISEDMGAAAIINAAAEAENAARAVRQQREELRAARAALAIARLPEGDSIAVAMAELGEAFTAQRNVIREFGRESVEYAESVQQVIDTRRSVQQAINDVAAAHASVASALASAAGLDIESARIDLGEAQRQLQAALREAGGNQNAAIVQEAMADVIQAEAAMRDTVLGEALDTIDFLEEMGDITANEAIAALQEIMTTMDLTEDQRRDLMRKIKGLQDDIANSLSGGFNIADVRLPTPYEVRRSLGIDEITEGIEEGRAALSDAFATANDALSPGGVGGSVLDSVLGPDLANEVRSVGTSVDALLPPISEVPGVIEATLASRDAIVAQLTTQLEAVYQLTTAQNESVGMLGATIYPPMELIQQQTALANEWLEIASNLQASGNEYLLHSLSEQYVHTEYLAAIAGNLAAMRDTSTRRFGMTQEAIDAEEARFRTGAEISRQRPREQDTRERLQPRDINPPEFQPRDIEHQQAIDYFTSPTPYAPQTTTVENRFETSVVVQAQTNADANEIARTVETRVNNSLRRQMNSNQSTPHLIRMR